MTFKKRPVKRYILPAILLIAAAIFALNIYLGKRLERYLRKELIERTTKATQGFYTLSFRHLSINLLNGELRVEGVEFAPDSTVFNQWMAIDSLPENYLKARIAVIDFKGINLIWRTNYKQLHFETFEIEEPNIAVYHSTFSNRLKKKTKNTTEQTLYELIQPYMNRLSVQTLHLKKACVSYTVSNQSMPAIYCLNNVDFNAFGFRVDAHSSKSGKLLYCDNFDFTTNQAQTLLSNSDFSLYTEKIHLSTKDSIISIKNIQLLPQETVWEVQKSKPSTYLNGEIKQVAVDGIRFTRENGLNFLTARSFKIDSSAIKLVNLSQPVAKATVRTKKNPAIGTDSIVQSLSLYQIISPILHNVAIQHIGIDNTQVDLFYTYKDSIERYRVNNLRFNAYDFLVDSVAETKQEFWYAQNFGFEASHIEGEMTARNHTIRVEQIGFNSTERRFIIRGLSLSPITTHVAHDYLNGRIDSICIEGLAYKQGVSAQLLQIESPSISYFKNRKATKKGTGAATKQTIEVADLLSPWLQYLSIGKIELNKGRLVYNDLSKPNPIRTELERFDLFATNVLLDEHTGKTRPGFLEFDQVGFHFKHLSHHALKDRSTLSIGNGSFSSRDQAFTLEKLAFSSHGNDSTKPSNHQINFTAASMRLTGFDPSLFQPGDSVIVDSIAIDSPHLHLSTAKNEPSSKKPQSLSQTKGNPLLGRWMIRHFAVQNSRIESDNPTENQQVEATLHSISLKNLSLDANKQTIGFDSLTTNLLTAHLSQKSIQADVALAQIACSRFHFDLQPGQSALSLSSFEMLTPDVKISLPSHPMNKANPTDSKQANIHHSLKEYIGQLTIDTFNLANGTIAIDYINQIHKPATQQLNTVNIGFDGLKIDNVDETVRFDDLRLKSTDLTIPIDNAFYYLHIGDIDLQKNQLQLSNLAFTSPYAKMEFAYKHPRHDDWFDAKIDRIALTDIDIPFYLQNQLLKIKKVALTNASLLNLKNRQIDVPLRLVPMIYEGIQKAPVRLMIEQIEVSNVDVTYEELATKKTDPGKFFLTEMNGLFTGFTNVATSPDQFIRLDANGKLMGEGYFTATWMLPVDTLNDRFLLNIALNDFDLTRLNEIVTPLAPASIRSGRLNHLTIGMDATSAGAEVDMLFLYKELKVDVFNDKANDHSANKLYSGLANLVLLDNNPRHPNRKRSKPREVHVSVVRDPYHSTFNYLWQIIRPAATESVGVSKKQQSFAKKIMIRFKQFKEKRRAKGGASAH